MGEKNSNKFKYNLLNLEMRKKSRINCQFKTEMTKLDFMKRNLFTTKYFNETLLKFSTHADKSTSNSSAMQSCSTQEYFLLKAQLLQQTKNFGFATVLYSFIIASPMSALCVLIGLTISLSYLIHLYNEIDSIEKTDSTKMLDVIEPKDPVKRHLSKFSIAYSHSINQRILLLILIFVICYLYNRLILNFNYRIGFLEEVSILGFFSFKFP